MLKAGQLGEVEQLTHERRELYERWLQDEQILAWQALNEIDNEMRDAHIAASADPGATLEGLLLVTVAVALLVRFTGPPLAMCHTA